MPAKQTISVRQRRPEANQARAQLQMLKASEYRVQLSFRSKHEAETVRASLQAGYGRAARGYSRSGYTVG